MKISFKFLLLGLLLSVGLTAFTIKAGSKSFLPPEPISSVMVLEQVNKVSGVTTEVIRLDTAQNAQCDTCYSNYISAIRENRQMSEKLSDKNLELYEKYNKSILLEKSLDSLHRVLESEKKRIVGTLNRIKNKEKKQE